MMRFFGRTSRFASVSRMGTSRTFSSSRDTEWHYNYSSGPAPQPQAVMDKAARDWQNFDNTGFSVMELSHREPNGPIQRMIENTHNLVRELLSVPDTHDIFFCHGGAKALFSAVPMNMMGDKKTADYVNTGFWSQMAIAEAKKYLTVNTPVDTTPVHTHIPDPSTWQINPDAAYVHMCGNETMQGVEFHTDPSLPEGSPPLVADFTSSLMSRPIDVSKYGIIFAAGGKNLGPSGCTLVIMRKDLIKAPHPFTPAIMDFSKLIAGGPNPIASILNTPASFILYMCGLCLEDIKARGGVEAAAERSVGRSRTMYDIIDGSNGFYTNQVVPEFRSNMNIPFRIQGDNQDLETQFVMEAKAAGLHSVKAHPMFGGMRITLYQGVADEALDAFAVFMKRFQEKHA